MDTNTVTLQQIVHFTQLTTILISSLCGVFVHGIAIVWYSTPWMLDQCVIQSKAFSNPVQAILQNQVKH